MRVIPVELQTRLSSGATTLCWCWRITRADGGALGFTDHDRDLAFDGVAYRAASARSAGDAESEAGFAPGAAAVSGVLSDAGLSEVDLQKGLFDDARADLYRVDWSDVALRLHLWSGWLGEVRFGEVGFEAELRGRAAALDRSIGRVFQRRCDARLGDVRCGVDLQTSALRGVGVVSDATGARTFRATGLAAFADGWFALGALRWTGGANAGLVSEVDVHRASGGEAALELLTPPPSAIAVDDAFSVDAGCDKRWATCKAKFANTLNFRGFPMTPGDDWLAAGPRVGEANDGASLWTERDT